MEEEENEKTFYLAAPMTGHPGYNKVVINKAAQHLRHAHNLSIIACTEVVHGKPAANEDLHAFYMRTDLRAMLDCDGIILMPGWPKSVGARAEFNAAAAAGLEIWYLDETMQLNDLNGVFS